MYNANVLHSSHNYVWLQAGALFFYTIKEYMLQVMLETLPTIGFAVQPAKMFLH